MEVLFIHPNFPGQFKHLLARLKQVDGINITGLGDEEWISSYDNKAGIALLSYPAPEAVNIGTHPHVKNIERAVIRGQQSASLLIKQKMEGYEPDLIYVHTGWGDALYLKEVFPNAKVVGLFEYYYHSRGADIGFDPMYPTALSDLFRVPLLNATQLLALESCDIHISPTPWQRSRFPALYRDNMRCLHEGVDTTIVKPNSKASITLPDGTRLKHGDEVLTFVSRGFEPYRGFHVFMRALPQILKQRPNCQVLLIGGDKNHYGPPPKGYDTWKESILSEMEEPIDMSRVHFTGSLPFDDYLAALQISRAHVYLTYPFVLSWSTLEAMAAGCLVIASDTAPVRDVIAHEVNGLLFPFFEEATLVATVVSALANPEQYQVIREAAVSTIKKRFDFEKVIFPQHLDIIEAAMPHKETR